jgi:hypothetical protein
MTGGNQFEDRTIIVLRLGDDAATRVPVQAGDFYGVAVA